VKGTGGREEKYERRRKSFYNGRESRLDREALHSNLAQRNARQLAFQLLIGASRASYATLVPAMNVQGAAQCGHVEHSLGEYAAKTGSRVCGIREANASSLH
jgi:hypothetical protein